MRGSIKPAPDGTTVELWVEVSSMVDPMDFKQVSFLIRTMTRVNGGEPTADAHGHTERFEEAFMVATDEALKWGRCPIYVTDMEHDEVLYWRDKVRTACGVAT